MTERLIPFEITTSVTEKNEADVHASVTAIEYIASIAAVAEHRGSSEITGLSTGHLAILARQALRPQIDPVRVTYSGFSSAGIGPSKTLRSNAALMDRGTLNLQDYVDSNYFLEDYAGTNYNF